MKARRKKSNPKNEFYLCSLINSIYGSSHELGQSIDDFFSSLIFFIPRREKFMLQRIILSEFKLEKMRRVFAALV